MVEASQRNVTITVKENKEEGVLLSRDTELQIKTLENAPRGPDKLELLLKVKQRQKE
jgi:hypothetical protein